MAQTGKNLHLEHLEDEIINKGTEGGRQAIKILRDMGKFLSGSPGAETSVTTKFDGAPAIVCGIDPADNSFFVGTKSVFAKNEPKICKSEQDCYTLYNGVLANKLATSYRYLSSIGIKGVLQGDLMFTDDKKNTIIDGQDFVTFRPNTITYAARRTSKLGQEITTARIGIVFHTKYTGDSLSTMTSSFILNKSDYQENSKMVWAQKAEFQNIGNTASFSGDERVKYNSAVNRAEGSFRQAGNILDIIQTGKRPLKIDTEFKKFFNKYVKEGRPIPSVEIAFNDFAKHLAMEYDKVILKHTRLETQSKKADLFVKDLNFLVSHKKQIKMLIATYMNIQVAKTMLIKKMNKISNLNMFVDTGNGDYKVTVPEGFVAISGRQAVKLVDRLEFSKLNFTVPKNW
jgi:hypothetical protein